MQSTLAAISATVSLALTGAMAGLFYAFSVSVMPGFDAIKAGCAIRSMQSINRKILYPVFLATFLLAPVAAAVTGGLLLWLDQTAAAVMLKGMTSQYLIRRTYPVKAGETVLFHAAAGGVGLIACQWLKALGATVIGTVGSDEKAEIARAHGCEHVGRLRDREPDEPVLVGPRGGEGVGVALGAGLALAAQVKIAANDRVLFRRVGGQRLEVAVLRGAEHAAHRAHRRLQSPGQGAAFTGVRHRGLLPHGACCFRSHAREEPDASARTLARSLLLPLARSRKEVTPRTAVGRLSRARSRASGASAC